MKILGLVTEYNPFHNGHLYHLDMSKKITNATTPSNNERYFFKGVNLPLYINGSVQRL